MKRLIFFIAFVFCFLTSKAQLPITQSIGSPTTLVQVPANGGLRAGLINRTFADTTAANATYLDYYQGCQIFTTTDSMFWIRDVGATRWRQLYIVSTPSGGGGSPVDTVIWRVSGTGQTVVNSLSGGGIGTANIVPLWLITSGAIRIQIPAAGIQRQTAARYKTMLYDTIDHNLGYGDAGAGSTPTWPQTLNAGATFDQSYTANGAGFNFNLYSAAGNILFNTKANSTSYGSRLYLNGDSAWYLGNNRAYVKSSGVGNKLHISTGQTSSDTTTYKPLAAQSSDGETVTMTYWPGGGGSGTVTSFSATDGNGFDFTVTNPTTTPTLTATTTVADTRLMYSSSGAITGSPRLTYDDNVNYPTLTIDGTYEGYLYLSSAVGGDNFRISGAAGGTLYGSDTYKSVAINDYIYGGQVARFYNSGGSNKLVDFNATVTVNDLVVYSNTRGCIGVERTVPYAITGNNYHGFTDETNFRLGSAAFNSFGSFVHFGNNTTNQDHYAAFQNVWAKDSSNTISKVYGFVNAVSEITGGTITDLYGYYHYSPTITSGTITNQYGVYVPVVTGATNNYGAYFGSNVGIGITTPSTPLHIINTTEQARIGYDVSNYYSTTVGSTGGVTLNAVGSGSRFTFSDAVTLGNLPSGAASDSVLTDASGDVKHRKVSDLISPYITTGTYTPTLSNTTNVSASTAYQCQYSVAADASGNQVVTVSGQVDIDPTTTVTLTVLRVTLPITSNVSQTYEIGGTANDELGTPARISGNVANDVAEIRFTPVDVTNRTFSFVFVYKVNIP